MFMGAELSLGYPCQAPGWMLGFQEAISGPWLLELTVSMSVPSLLSTPLSLQASWEALLHQLPLPTFLFASSFPLCL